MATSNILKPERVPKTLWSGTWNGGSITVPNTQSYTVFMIIQGGAPVLALRNGNTIRGTATAGNAASGNFNQYVRVFGASISGSTWTLEWAKQLSHVTDANYHVSGAEQSVTSIIGLI